MRYPRKSPYLIYKRSAKDEYRIENYLYSESYRLNNKAVAFLKCLDGRHNPYKLLPGHSKADVRQKIRELKACHLLAPKKEMLVHGIGSCMYPLIYCYPGRLQKFLAQIYNFLLMALFIPVFILGLCYGTQSTFHVYAQSKGELFAAMILGTVIGVAMHELSHTCAGLAYGAHIFEIGIGTQFFIPMEYVLMDDSNVRNRLQKIQINAAGIEMNFLLYGVFMLLIPSGFVSPFIIKACSLVNLVMAILNALPLNGLDGMKIISTVFKKEDLLKYAKRIIRNRKKQGRKPERSVGTIAVVAASYGLIGFQIVLPLLLIYEGYSLVRLILL